MFADGYIAKRSGHSRGSTVDLTIVKLPPRPQRPSRPGEALKPCFAPDRFPDNMVDMGRLLRHALAHRRPADPRRGRTNRQLLKGTLAAAGFRNLVEEWWHYTFNGEPFPDTYFDFPVSRHSLTCTSPAPDRD